MAAHPRQGRRKRRRRIVVVGALAIITALAGTAYYRATTKSSAEDYFASAQTLFQGGDQSGALIEVKNALQADPGHVGSRVLAGTIYLQLADGLSAEKELNEAIKLGADTPDIHLGLLRAMLHQRRYDEVIGRLLDVTLDSRSIEFHLIRGAAWLGSGNYENARADFEHVLAAEPDNTEAHRGLTKLALATEDFDEAGRQADKILDLSAADLEGWVLKGEVSLGQKDYEGAEAAFMTALTHSENHLLARIGLVRALLAQNKPDTALPHIEILAQANPYSAVSSYLAALAARQKGDIPAMQLALREVLKLAPNHPDSLLLLGAAHYRSNELELARDVLSRYVDVQPDDLRGSKLLAALFIKREAYDQAIALLEKAASDNPEDPQLLTLLGSAYMATKEYAKANELMTRASELEPGISSIRTQLALTHFATGETDKGVSELKSIMATDPGFERADYLLLLVHLRKREFDEALAIAQKLARDQPENPVPQNLIAASHEGLGDLAQARTAYEQALAIKPDYVTAALNLARLDFQGGDLEAAKERYSTILKAAPDNVFALEALARFALHARQMRVATKLLERARAASETAVNPRILLAAIYLQSEPRLALEVAQEAYEAESGTPRCYRPSAALNLLTDAFKKPREAMQL